VTHVLAQANVADHQQIFHFALDSSVAAAPMPSSIQAPLACSSFDSGSPKE